MVSTNVLSKLTFLLSLTLLATASPVPEPSDITATNSTLVAREPYYTMKVNYYTDTGCTNWLNSVSVSSTFDGKCVGYYLQKARSANIANCYDERCTAQFWSGTGCSSGWGSVFGTANSPSGSNCVRSDPDNGQWFQSFVPKSYYSS